jgi:hypothetical protein
MSRLEILLDKVIYAGTVLAGENIKPAICSILTSVTAIIICTGVVFQTRSRGKKYKIHLS